MDGAMAEVILMDFLSASTADSRSFSSTIGKRSGPACCWLYLISAIRLSSSIHCSRELFGALSAGTNFAGDIFPVPTSAAAVPQLFPPLRKSVLHNLAKICNRKFRLPFVAWRETNNRRGDLRLRNKKSAGFGDTRRGDEVAVAR